MYRRKKPYTASGINRIPCFRCGSPAVHQWSICSDDNVWRAICVKCDIALNKTVLCFMKFEDVTTKIEKYRIKISNNENC